MRSVWLILSCGEVHRTGLRCESSQCVVNNIPQVVDGAYGSFPQERLELEKGVLDRVEVG